MAVSGSSMKTNIQIARNLGYMKIGKDVLIPLEEIGKYRDDKILVLCTGAQGEPQAQLMRIASGEHRYIQVKKGDTVRLQITSMDTDHGFAIAEFGVNATIPAGKTVTVEFVADRQGTFTTQCSVFCGTGHPDMQGTLIVE